jgi:predicted amidohydrolase
LLFKLRRPTAVSNPFRVACVQFTAAVEAERNIGSARRLMDEALRAGAALIAFPEYFGGVRSDGAAYIPTAFPEGSHPVLAAMRESAKAARVWLLLGSMGVTVDGGKIANRSYVIDSDGHIAARYDKIHLFDVDLGPGEVHRESATISPGSEAVVAETPWGKLGLSVCYDLRFPQLYQALARAGSTMLAVPAGFTRLTGKAHWHVLNRARAIETGSYVIAPCQNGTLAGGATCHGHSLIVDPWGTVLADGGEGEGIITAEVDPAKSAEARRKIPALANARPFTVRTTGAVEA